MSLAPPTDLSQWSETLYLRHEIQTIKELCAFKALRPKWDKLIAAAEDYSFCMMYQYCELAAALVLGAGDHIEMVMVYDNHDLLAIWPLAIHRKGPLLIAKALTCGNGEEYGGAIIKGTERRMVVAETLRAAMEVQADLLSVIFVEDGSELQRALNSAPQSWLLPLLPKEHDSFTGHSIRLRGFAQFDDFLATISKSLRSNLKRGLSQLSAKGHTEVGWCATADDAKVVLNWLFANKRRWAITRDLRTKYLMDDRVRDFFIELASCINLSATPLVAFVKVNGVPVAASVNLVGCRSVEGFITTYDESFGRYSVGMLLVDFIVRWAHTNGRDFDFRPLHANYKSRWANHETRHKKYLIFLTPRGRLAEIPLLARAIYSRLAPALSCAKRKVTGYKGHLVARG